MNSGLFATAGFAFALACGAAWAADPTPPPAAAPAPSPNAPSAAPGAAPEAEPKICRRMEVTGSHLSSVRVCKTRKEWAAYDADQDDENVRGERYMQNHTTQTVPR